MACLIPTMVQPDKALGWLFLVLVALDSQEMDVLSINSICRAEGEPTVSTLMLHRRKWRQREKGRGEQGRRDLDKKTNKTCGSDSID